MKIEKLDNHGRGISYYNDKIMFIKNALPEEDVVVSNIIEKNKFYLAEVSNITNESTHRVIPKCPYYNECGGCNLAHTDPDYEDEYKRIKIEEILRKYANTNIEVKFIKNDKELFYRNKVSLKIVNGKWGYFNESTHELCQIDKCLIANNTINELISKKDVFKIMNGLITIRCNYENQLLIDITSSDKVDINNNIIPNNIIGIIVNKRCVYGDTYFYDYIGDLKFKVSYNSFFQVNNYMASCIFNILRNNLKGNNLLDLYCGVGTLGLALKDNFKTIYGIEKIENAIIDAKENALNNGITNASYFAGDTSKVLHKINKKFDTIIVDPPRSGLNLETIKQIIELKPKNLCYVSCDPMTLARDLKILKDNRYKIMKVNALNMFPKTYHVECVCLLSYIN